LAIWVSQSPGKNALAAVYRRAAQKSLNDQDLAAADVFFRRLSGLERPATEAQYGLALVAELRGDPTGARQLMEGIAPADRPGHAPAHLWLARQLQAAAESAKPSEQLQQLQAMETHLRHVLQTEPQNVEAHHTLGQWYSRIGRFDKAIEHFAPIVNTVPDCRLTLAQMYVLAGNRTLAESHGKAARDEFEQKAKRNPADLDAELMLARAELFLSNPQRAVEILTRGLERTNDDRFRRDLVSTYLSWFDRTSAQDLARRLDLLQKAMSYGPAGEQVLIRFQAFMDQESQESAKAKQILERVVAEGKETAIAHFFLAILSVRASDHASARTHLETAYRERPQTAVIANNLAWILANSEPFDLPRALDIANRAVELSALDPQVRETRGQILAKLGRYRESIADLESALEALPNTKPIHETLAKAYEHLGEKELSAAHRRHAQATKP
jgi:predicted Zn-dependent protease